MNELKQLKTIQHQTPEGPFYAIVMALDMDELPTARTFVHQVLEKFKMQWMIGPPGTTHLLVTVVGEVSATQFAEYWQEKTLADSVLTTIMSLMKVAEVLRGSATGEILERVTLFRAG